MKFKLSVGIFALLSLPAFADHGDHHEPTGFTAHSTGSPSIQAFSYDQDSVTVDVLENAPHGECFAGFTLTDADISAGERNHRQVKNNNSNPILKHDDEKPFVCLYERLSRPVFDYETQTRHELPITLCDCGDFFEQCRAIENSLLPQICADHPAG